MVSESDTQPPQSLASLRDQGIGIFIKNKHNQVTQQSFNDIRRYWMCFYGYLLSPGKICQGPCVGVLQQNNNSKQKQNKTKFPSNILTLNAMVFSFIGS